MPGRNFAEIVTGAAVLLVAAGFMAYAVAHSGRTETGGYLLHASFDNIGGLSVGSDVRLGGVKVGSVMETRINPENFLAEVNMRVSDAMKLPKDTSAAVTSDGLLGGKYLALSPGGDTAILPPGGTITITQSSVSIEQLLGKFIFSATSPGGAAGSGSQGGGSPGGSSPGGGSPGSSLGGGLQPGAASNPTPGSATK
jgi:phospholipid/cholesterol/gamma-HCH transport system substrate-binding protein